MGTWSTWSRRKTAQEHPSRAFKFGDSGYACVCPSSSKSNSSRPVRPPLVLSYLSSFDNVDRIWTLTFSVLPRKGSENWWFLSLGLADHSIPAWVDGDLVISGNPPPTNEADVHETSLEPPFTIPIRHDLCELKPGSENAIRIRLDDGPMGPHLLNECVTMRPVYPFSPIVEHSFQRSQALVDSDGTLHAEFTVRLTRPIHSVLLTPSIDLSDTASQVSSAMDAATTSTTISSESPRSPISLNFRKKEKERDPSKPVYATLRRGGR